MSRKIWIASPYYRTGSTLIQRCLHACDNTVMYGEMNGLFGTIIQLIGTVSNGAKQNNINKKLENFNKKVDDDYSCCCPHERGLNLPKVILDEIFKDIDISQNLGFKSISCTIDEINCASHISFDIIYINRPVEEAMSSYLKTPWGKAHGPRGFMMAYNRSFDIINNPNWAEKFNGPNRLYKLEYKNIHFEIGQIIKDLGLNICEEKLTSILSNKINSGC